MQMRLFNSWIDGRTSQPEDGQKVLAYLWIENPDEQLSMFKKFDIEYDGITISGPIVTCYEKQFVDEGVHRKLALWQPIEELPNLKTTQATP